MSVSLPHRRNRRYLTGIDWIMCALNHGARQNSGMGTISQAVLEVEGALDDQALQKCLAQISTQLPLLHGRIARDWGNLAPYWKSPNPNRIPQLVLRVVDLPENAFSEADRLFDDHLNAPFESESTHLRFLLVRIGASRSRLGMVFDHRLFDAFGAEAFFRLIDQTWQNQLDHIAPRFQLTEPAHLDHWVRRFNSGKTLNKLLFHLNEQDVCGLASPPFGVQPRICCVHDSLTMEQTERFQKIASEEIGMPVILPSATARAVLAMRRIFPSTPLPGTQHLVFTSSNARSPGQEWEAFLFNHFSFLMLSVERKLPDSPKELTLNLRDQLFEQMKQQIPFAMQDSAALWRILPAGLADKLTRLLFKGRVCSFYFACLRESGFAEKTFLGQPVADLVHWPMAFSPPGLNICMTWFAGRFNLVVSYIQGVMDDATARQLMGQFKSLLLE